jgi:hypothetical protein
LGAGRRPVAAAAVRSGEEELDPVHWRPDPAVASSIRCGGDGSGSGAVVAAVDSAVEDPLPPQALPLPFPRCRYSLPSEQRSERRGKGRGSRGRCGAGRSSGAVEDRAGTVEEKERRGEERRSRAGEREGGEGEEREGEKG